MSGAAKIFVQDKSFDAFVGWSPDIYTVSGEVKDTRLVVSTGSANHLIADVWAVRNDFFRDQPAIVSGLVQGIFEGMDMVRKDIPNAARLLSAAYKLPVEDCTTMIGKDGGIIEGDAHLTNYRENSNFFLDAFNPSNFEVVWNRASTIYKTLGAISVPVPAAKVKAAAVLAKLSENYKEVRDLSQPTFKPSNFEVVWNREVGRVEGVEEEIGILAIVGEVGVALDDAAVLANHRGAILDGELIGGGEEARGVGDVLSHHVHAFKNALHEAGDDGGLVAEEIVAHGPDVGDQVVRAAGADDEASVLHFAGNSVDVR